MTSETYTEGYGIKISEIITHLSFEKILPYIAQDLNRDEKELRRAAKERWCNDGESLVSMYENDIFVAKVIADICKKKDMRMILDITKDANHDIFCVSYPHTESYYQWDTKRQTSSRPYISCEDFTNIMRTALTELCDDGYDEAEAVHKQKVYNLL